MGSTRTHDTGSPCCTPCNQCAGFINHWLQRILYLFGRFVGRHAVLFIMLGLAAALGFGSGYLRLNKEIRPEVLWLPSGSAGERDAMNSLKLFPIATRTNTVIFSAENVLTPTVIKKILSLDKQFKAVNKDVTDSDWETLCIRLADKCWSRGLLELWNFDESIINSLDEGQIMTAVNNAKSSPYFGGGFDSRKVLGGVELDSQGRIIKATSTNMFYLLIKNETEENGDPVWRERALDFEKGLLDLVKHAQEEEKDLNYYYYFWRSYQDEFADAGAKEAIFLLAIGYSIMTVFVVSVIGKFNRLEQRIYLTAGGLLAIALALLIAMGLGTYLGFFYGPIQNILALLLLGIGVDDIFIITHALDKLPSNVRYKSTGSEQVGLAMKYGGASITVTSLTDFAAFAVGATTIIPALRSFCVYCAIGLLAMYILQITFFTACLSLDRWRVTRRRDACLPCIVLSQHFVPTPCSEKSLLSWFFKKIYSKIVTHVAFKAFIILITLPLMAAAIYGCVHLKVKTDFGAFFPVGTYPREYFDFLERQYPNTGLDTVVYFSGEIDYYTDHMKVDKLHIDLKNDQYIRNDSVLSWYQEYRNWLREGNYAELDADYLPDTEEKFYQLLVLFLSNEGQSFVGDIRFENDASKIKASRIRLSHANTNEDTDLLIKALDNIRRITGESGLGAENCFPYTDFYIRTDVDKVIGEELLRNIGLALLCMAVVTLPLIASFITCILVLCTVTLTLTYVGGTMYYFGINVDFIGSITLILSLGLTVDYAAHIGHTFMKFSGSRNERVAACLGHIGDAVFLGGFSTLLAISPMVVGKTYTIKAFFSVFTMVIVFGLFNGLALLPVILSIVGPSPYSQSEDTSDEDQKSNRLSGIHNPALDLRPDEMDGPPRSRYTNGISNHHRRNTRDRRRDIGNVDRHAPPRRSHSRRHSSRGMYKGKQNERLKSRTMFYSEHFGRAIPVYNKQIIRSQSLPHYLRIR